MFEDIEKILFREQDILLRVEELARQINCDYEGKELVMVAFLNGSFIFLADLVRKISLPVHVECMRVSSYEGVGSTGSLKFEDKEIQNLTNRHVLLIDDILDTGTTLKGMKEWFLQKSRALSIRTCVLLQKRIARTPLIEADYMGFEIENEFVVGYGLDYREYYRNLPFIGVLKSEAIDRPQT
ncbi:MAG: hypoxanthine phosphoribosyltransferase [Chthoniobacterales bacterium]